MARFKAVYKSITFSRALALALALILFSAGPAAGAKTPAADPAPAQPGEAGQSPSAPELVGVRLGDLDEYTRLIFKFSSQIGQYEVFRADVDKVILDFGPADSTRLGEAGLGNDVVDNVSISRDDGRLLAQIRLKPPRFTFRHFESSDRTAVVIDLRSESAAVEGRIQEQALELALPSASVEGQRVRDGLPAKVDPETDAGLLAQAAEQMIQGNYNGAILTLDTFKETYPNSPYLEQVLFLSGDAHFFANPDDFPSEFLAIISAYKEAIDRFPSPRGQAPRATLMLAKAYEKMQYNNEAGLALKKVMEQYPSSPYALNAELQLAGIHMKLSQFDQAEKVYQSVLSKGARGDLVFEAYAKLGEAFFMQGLFSRANEIFKEILKLDESYYQRHPDILYYMGEGYFHLGRMDLARAYLYHARNMNPEGPLGARMMALIGDTYKAENQEVEATKIYALTRELYPKSEGALVSLMRLADFGALREIFGENDVFQEMEDGSRETTIKIYKLVLESAQDSGIVQLALSRLGQAYHETENYDLAIKTFQEVLTRFPEAEHVKAIEQALADSIYEEAQNRYALMQYQAVADLYETNRKVLDKNPAPGFWHYLALSYMELRRPETAVAVWERHGEIKDQAAERLLGLGRAYEMMGRFQDAARTMAEFSRRFPDHDQRPEALVTQARAEISLGEEDQGLRLLEEAVTLKKELSEDALIQSDLARLYLNKGDWAQGAEAMAKAVDVLEKNQAPADQLFMAYSRMGRALAGLGEKDKAEKALDQALEFWPEGGYPDILYLIARSYGQIGLAEKKEKTLEKMLTTPDQFWREVADHEMLVLKPDQKISRLLEGAAAPR